MRHLYLCLFILLLCYGCSSNTPPPPTVYTYGSSHRFIVQKQGEPNTEELTLLIGDGPASNINTEKGFSLKIGGLNGPSATWQRINSVTGDKSYSDNIVVTDQGPEFGISFPETELLPLARFIPALYFDRTMEPAHTKQSRSLTVDGNRGVNVNGGEEERTYLGTTMLTLPDTTYTAVHQLRALLKSKHGTTRETYYFHDSLGFVHARIIMPDSSIVTFTRAGTQKKKPQI